MPFTEIEMHASRSHRSGRHIALVSRTAKGQAKKRVIVADICLAHESGSLLSLSGIGIPPRVGL